MKRTTFLIAALVMLLVAGVLLVMGIAAQKSRPVVAAAPVTGAGSANTPTRPATSASGPGTLPTLTTLLATLPSTNPTSLPAVTGALPLEPGTHDPVMIKEGDYYYVLFTGRRINELRSKDLVHWDSVGLALPGIPNWIAGAVPSNRGDLWAPDISLHNGKFFLYYAASTFGTNTSGIGLATNKTLNTASPDYKWSDDGLVIASKASDFYNCIDPNAFFDSDGTAWLTFGSFYWNQGGGRGGQPANPDAAIKGGIELVKLDAATGKVLADAKPLPIASRAYPERAIEAPFLIRNGDWYYLFVSWDRCCQGVRSTYRIMVGRSKKVTGPYLDKEDKDMVKGGGTQILAGDGQRIIGPGHQGLFKDGDHWLMVHHFYDGSTNGTSRLQVRPVTFNDKDWPVLGKAINSPG